MNEQRFLRAAVSPSLRRTRSDEEEKEEEENHAERKERVRIIMRMLFENHLYTIMVEINGAL